MNGFIWPQILIMREYIIKLTCNQRLNYYYYNLSVLHWNSGFRLLDMPFELKYVLGNNSASHYR